MSRVDMSSTDIMLDNNGQPVANQYGDFDTVNQDSCWIQDIHNEALTEEGELFYEEDNGTESYGFSLLDFIQVEHDEFFESELVQRIKEKLSTRVDVDERTIIPSITTDGKNVVVNVRFKTNGSDEEYNIEVGTNEIEVITDA